MIFQNKQLLTAKFHYYYVALQVVRLTLVMCSIYTQDYLSVLQK